MCIKIKEKPEIHIAEKDIKVIKILSYREKIFKFLFFKFRKRDYISPYMDKRYKLKKLYESEISYDVPGYYDGIHYITRKGLYSFANEDSITTNFAFYPIQPYCNRGIFNAIIPRGARYYTNGKGEFCSDSLKILSYKKDLNLVVDYKTGKVNW